MRIKKFVYLKKENKFKFNMDNILNSIYIFLDILTSKNTFVFF